MIPEILLFGFIGLLVLSIVVLITYTPQVERVEPYVKKVFNEKTGNYTEMTLYKEVYGTTLSFYILLMFISAAGIAIMLKI